MALEIVGTLPVNHFVDQNGSFSINVPLQFPHAKLIPQLSLAYHSAANSPSAVGLGWVIKGASYIERVPATIDQDGRRGVVNYDKNDCFALDGQRLIRIGLSPTETEYRFEVERWSKIFAYGDPANPTFWEEHLPNGTIRKFGDTTGGTTTRVWAISQHEDTFTNYISFAYNNDVMSGSFYLTQLKYGGNLHLNMEHQREVFLEYESRPDKRTTYLGGHKICIDRRLAFIESRVYDKVVHKHILTFNTNAVTQASRLEALTLADASGTKLRPLKFNWTSGPTSIFNPNQETATIKMSAPPSEIFPMDVTASGKSDIVIVSNRHDPGNDIENALHLAVHLADGQGKVHEEPSPGSGFTGLRYPDQLLPLDVTGDGKTDLLHIVQIQQTYYNLTVLVSTGTDGRYQAQKTFKFLPEFSGGSFYSGDFTGDGRVGLLYVYENNQRSTLRFVQFRIQHTSEDYQFTPDQACDGPKNFRLQLTHVIVGDLDGKGAEDVFFISKRPKAGGDVCDIHLVRSVDGTLCYNADEQPLKDSGDSVRWLPSTTFHPYAADSDGKTSLLVVSKSDNQTLQWQLLRSTGPRFLPQPSPTVTTIPYHDQVDSMGCVTLAKIISTFSVELVATYKTPQGPKVHVLRFDGEKFIPISGVQDPKAPAAAIVRWADLRGVGRTDYTLHTYDAISPRLKMDFISSSSSSQPVDFISGYENGLGAKITATYASISDSRIYTTTDDKLIATTAAVNAMARNTPSSVGIAPSSSSKGSSAAQHMGRSRTQVVHFPAFVVEEISSATQPGVVDSERQSYTYTDAKLDFDGRGWLGFKTIARSRQPVGTSEVTTYSQTFPFLGQVRQVMTTEVGGHKLVEKGYEWHTVSLIPNHPKIHSVRLRNMKESHYDAGAPSFNVDVSYRHDSYANVKQVAIKSSQPGVPMITTHSEFAHPAGSWIIGNKTREYVTQESGGVTSRLKDTEYAYHPGTTVSSKISNWVADSVWVDQTFEFDPTGNETLVKGPGPARRQLTYDETHSNVVSSLTFYDDTTALKETAVYDLALGKPLLVTDANGYTVSRSYDMLGRILKISQGENPSSLAVIEKRSFHYEGGQFYQIRKVSAGRTIDDKQWSTTKAYIDGVERAWKFEMSRPDDLTATISSQVQYDGAGRIVAHCRDHLAGSMPAFTKYKYNARSQVIEQISPPAASGVSPIKTTYEYKFESGRGKIIEVRSEDSSVTNKAQQVVTRELLYLPNPHPSPDKLVKPVVSLLTNELGQDIQTQFDGLGRPVSVNDPSGVELSLSWDSLSRQVERRLSQPGSKGKIISHFSLQYDDMLCKNTVINRLTNSTTVTQMDYQQRPTSRTTADQVTTFTYDKGGVHSRGRIVDVISKTGTQEQYKQHFDYDIQGNLTRGCLSLDGYDYVTSHEWTPAGQLSKTINPDGTIATHSYLPDGETVHKIELVGANGGPPASVTFSGYDNAYLRPLVSQYGNGIKSTSSIVTSGALSSMSLSHGNNELHRQDWTIDAFTRIGKYEVSHTGVDRISNSFQYDIAGQLVNRSSDSSSPSTRTTSDEAFSYDHSGNLCSKDGKSFINEGWLLTAIQDQHGVTECSFEYSKDGNLTSKVVNEIETSTMKYDADGQLVNLDGTTFVYDYGGRMIKSVLPNGDATIYPSETYEVSISASGKKSHTAYLFHGYRRASVTTVEESPGEAASTNVYYFHSDHQGSTIAASDIMGNIITRYKYETFGKVVVDGQLDVARYKYQGKEQFGNLYNFGARFYDPDTARFLTLDDYPTSLREISPSTLNMYTFSRNDPINFIDLNGNVPWWHWLVDAVLVVAGAAATIAGFGIIGSTLLGAGISGLTSDIDAVVNHDGKSNDSDWGIQLGLGAAFGFAGGVIGAGIDAVIPALSSTEVSVVRAIGGFLGKSGAVTGGLIARTALRVALTAATDSSLSVLQQISDNAIAGKPLNDDLGTAAWMGVVSSPSTILSGFESVGMLRKISKAGRWNKAGKWAQAAKKTLAPRLKRGISKNLQYPLKQTKSALKIRDRPSSSFVSTLSKSFPAAASDFMSHLDRSDIHNAQKFLHAQDIPGL